MIGFPAHSVQIPAQLTPLSRIKVSRLRVVSLAVLCSKIAITEIAGWVGLTKTVLGRAVFKIAGFGFIVTYTPCLICNLIYTPTYANPVIWGTYLRYLTIIGILEYIDLQLSICNTTTTFDVAAKGGGGYYTDTRLLFETNGTITNITGKGSTDANDSHVRIGVSTTNSNFFDIQSSSWINVPSTHFNTGSFYTILNSKWGTNKDTYMDLEVTIEGANPTLTYTEIDTYTDDLDYVNITPQ